MSVLCETTPGRTFLPSGSFTRFQSSHSCSCWGFAPSTLYCDAFTFRMRSSTFESGRSVLWGPIQLPQHT